MLEGFRLCLLHRDAWRAQRKKWFPFLGYYCITEGPLKGLESVVFPRKYAIYTR